MAVARPVVGEAVRGGVTSGVAVGEPTGVILSPIPAVRVGVAVIGRLGVAVTVTDPAGVPLLVGWPVPIGVAERKGVVGGGTVVDAVAVAVSVRVGVRGKLAPAVDAATAVAVWAAMASGEKGPPIPMG